MQNVREIRDPALPDGWLRDQRTSQTMLDMVTKAEASASGG